MMKQFEEGQYIAASGKFTEALQRDIAKLPGKPEAFGYLSALVGQAGIVLVYDEPDRLRIVHLDPETVLQLTITKRRNGKTLDPPLISFDGFPEFSDDPSSVPPAHSGRCILCHTAGVIPIAAVQDEDLSLVASYGTRKAKEVVAWFNSEIASKYGNARLATYASQDIPFPPIGEYDPPTRTDAFMKKCIAASGKNVLPGRVKTVQSAMSCTECHNGTKVGTTNPYIQTKAFPGNLVDHLIREGLMPPNTNLSPDERDALVFCLRAEYFAGFTDPKLNLGNISEPGTILRELGRVKCPTAPIDARTANRRRKPGMTSPAGREKKGATRTETPAI